MYQIYTDERTGIQMIVRIEDMAWIPLDSNNRDYQRYLEWVEEGNEAGQYQASV